MKRKGYLKRAGRVVQKGKKCIANECFKGGDVAHKGEIANYTIALKKCEDVLEALTGGH